MDRPPPPRYLKAQEVADMLDVKVATVRAWWRMGELGGIDLGSKAGLRFTQDDVARFVQAKTASAKDRRRHHKVDGDIGKDVAP